MVSIEAAQADHVTCKYPEIDRHLDILTNPRSDKATTSEI